MSAPHVIPVLLDAVAIGDGTFPPPRVGEIISVPTRFQESTEDEPSVFTVHGRLEPDAQHPSRMTWIDAEDPPLTWSGMLYTRNWNASWTGRVPRTGDVELTGELLGVMEYDGRGRVRGRVQRIRLVHKRYHRLSGMKFRQVGPLSYQEVGAPTRDEAMGAGEVEHADGSGTMVIGALVDLDLNVPDPPARPSILPADISSAAGALWASDEVLPLVVRLGADGAMREYLLPNQVRPEDRLRPPWRLRATPAGCWASGVDDLFWLGNGDAPRRVAGRHGWLMATSGDTVLTVRKGEWTRYSPDGSVRVIYRGDGDPRLLATDGDDFVLLVQDDSDGTHRLARVGPDGEVVFGGAPVPVGRGQLLGFSGAPLRLFSGDRVAPVEGLTLGEAVPVSGAPLFADPLGRYTWLRNRERAWLADPDGGTVVTVGHGRRARAAADADGPLWILGSELHRIDVAHSDRTEIVDLGLLLDAHRSAAADDQPDDQEVE